MKVVAHIPGPYGTARILVEMSAAEIARLQGFTGYVSSDVLPSVGTTFDINKAWELMIEHRGAVGRLEGAAKTLRALAELCEQQAPQLLADPVEVKAP